MRLTPAVLAGLGLLCLPAAASSAGEWGFTAEVGVEGRWFPQDAAGTSTGKTVTGSLTAEPEAVYAWNDGSDRITVKPFLRLDTDDPRRTHGDLRAASLLHRGDDFDLLAGVDKVFWGVTESLHLVDIVNQTDTVENVDGEDKLGQPMVNLSLYPEWGTINLFVLPYFRERPFHHDTRRLAGALPVRVHDATYDSGLREWHPDLAIRYGNVFGDFDVGLSHFHGTSREPRAVTVGGAVVPHYDIIDQTGLDMQYTTGPWLWKLEAMTRSGHGERFGAVVGGVEYTLYGLFGGDSDLGLLMEGQYDGRGAAAPATSSDNDVFVGTRLTLNDTQDTDALIGVVIDVEEGTTAVSLEAKRRIGETCEARIEGRFFVDVSADDPARGIERDDHVTVRLARFF